VSTHFNPRGTLLEQSSKPLTFTPCHKKEQQMDCLVTRVGRDYDAQAESTSGTIHFRLE
jgi:hypothetical protein